MRISDHLLIQNTDRGVGVLFDERNGQEERLSRLDPPAVRELMGRLTEASAENPLVIGEITVGAEPKTLGLLAYALGYFTGMQR